MRRVGAMVAAVGCMMVTHHLAIVAFALLRICQYRVRLADLGETVGGPWVIAVVVRVCFFGENVELPLQFSRRRCRGHLEDVIVCG